MVRIICRIKPPKKDNIELASEKKVYLYKRSKNLLNKSIMKPYQFELDKFYDYNIDTREIYNNEIKPKLEKDFGVFIYGHTGSGKTYTMFGNENTKGIFDMISEDFNHTYELEAVDIRYNGNFDLFSHDKIVLYSDGKQDNCYNSTKIKINSINYDRYKQLIFNSRTSGRSKYNNSSSRSHLVLYIYKDNKKYTIVDLAGNERKPVTFSKINDQETRTVAKAEREVLKVLEGDCDTAVGVFAKSNGKKVDLLTELFSIDGKNRYFIKKSLQKDNIESTSRMVGEELKLKSKGSYKN